MIKLQTSVQDGPSPVGRAEDAPPRLADLWVGPVILVANLVAVAVCWTAVVHRGATPLTFYLVPCFTLATASFAERRFPRGGAEPAPGELRASYAAFVFLQTIASTVMVWLDGKTAGALRAAWAGLGWDPRPAIEGLPVVVRVVLAVTAADLFRYWVHRACHEVPALWRLHRLHHHTRSLRAVHTFRLSFLEYGLHEVPIMGLLLALGFPGGELALSVMLTQATSTLSHADSRLSFGALGRILSTRDAHEWHHDVAYRGNYSVGVHVLFDRLFGTFAIPPGRPTIGCDSAVPIPTSPLAHFIEPFRSEPEARR